MLVTLVPGQVFAAGTGSGQTTQAAQQKNPFTDVKSSDWFYDAVRYVYANGLFSGTSSAMFTPDGTMTRGMFVTVLGRMAGVDASAYSGDTGFSDVPQTQYYAPYVKWAAKHGITSGTSKERFSPEAFIDRQQMAAFFVRYFEKFNVAYDTGANVTTTPSDIDTVAAYARDAVMKLWKAGLLNGNKGKFDPKGNATRAQTATLCMRTDNSVKTWYKEPGVASDRVKVDPDAVTEEPGKTEEPSQGNNAGNTNNGGSSSGGSSGGGGGSSSTTYYEVKFAMVDGKDASGITWPETATYKKGTAITDIATPFKQNSIFLGWYYDAAGEKAVESGDTVDRNMTLYADMAEGQDVSGIETPNYVTVADQSTGFTFSVTGGSNIKSGMKLTCITAGNEEMSFNVSGNTVSAAFEAGQTYQFELTDDSLRFVVNGAEQDSHIRYLNVLTKKAEVANAELNSGLIYVQSKEVSGLNSGAYGGLFSSDVSTQTTETNETTGTFKYSGSEKINAGDTVAIYAGIRPDKRDLLQAGQDDGEVAYVNITDVSGDTYTYVMADVEDVLQVPDILPVPVNADKDGDASNNSVTVENTVIQDALKNVDASAIDEGDMIAFYSGSYNGESTVISSYAEITRIRTTGTDFIIDYKVTSNDIESALDSSLDVYYEQDEKIEMSDSEIKDLEDAIKNDVVESGYVEQASKYLAAYALETDGFNNVPADMDINARMNTIGELKTTLFGSTLRAKNVKVDFDRRNIAVRINANTYLDKLSGNGVKVEVSIPFEVSIGNNVKIKVTAKLNEQVILSTSISTKRIKIKFLKYDYALNAGFTVGNYTGIEFTADVTTDGDEGSLSEKLDEIMDIMEQQAEGATVSDADGTVESISEIYKNLMDNANDTWIDLVDQKIFGSSGNAFLHIFCWEVKGSFVVSANLNVSIGMKYEYVTKKQYNFSVRVKARTSTNQTIDLITPHYNFDFYVVGMLGVRAGLRLEMYVGLFSLKVDRIGIMAEVGAYAQLWGYFFYHLEWTQGVGKDQNYAGAMLIEIGTYIDIKFLAQLFNSSKLSWNPTIYAHQWPMWSAGSVQNIYGFANDGTDYTFKTVKTLAIPGDTFLMKSMNLKTGEISNVSKDDASESNFTISFSNKAFSYDPKTNTVTVTPPSGSVAETTDMTVTWKNAPLALSSKPISKVLKLSWSDPEGVRYISFDSQGGSAVDQITGGSGAAITWPADPVREGYTFGGWYTNKECTGSAYTPVSVMPTFTGNDKGVTLYAKWTPAEVNYTVEYYMQELNGTYTLDATQTATGTTESETAESYTNPYVGFTMQTPERKTIAADGSTLIQLYLDRNEYTVRFDSGTSDVDSFIQKYLYGADLQKPVMTRLGYKFAGWTNDPGDGTTVTGDAVYTAKWDAEPVTYKVKHIRQSVDGTYDESGELVESELKDSFTDADTKAEARTYEGFTALPFEQKTTAADGSTVVEIRYERNKYPVSWNTNGGSELTGEYTNGDAVYGAPVTKPADPTKTGYVFGGWYTDSELTKPFEQGMLVPLGGLTLYAKWDASKDTKYTVEHYQQTLAETDTAGYELVASDMMTGTTEQPTAAAAKVYIGFTVKPFDQAVVAADGSTVVKIYYDRNVYPVSWNVNGGSELTGDYLSGDQKFGTPVTKPADPTKTGYIFDGWYTDSECTKALENGATVPVGGLDIYAKWTPSSNTKYTVEHYKQNLGDAEYALADTDEMTGTTGQQTAAEAKDYEGFTAEAVSQKTIAADGTTVVEIRYSRNSYNVSWNVNGGSALAGEYTNGSAKYGTTIVLPAAPTKQGYVFDGWYLEENLKEKMPENMTVPAKDVVLYAAWTPAEGTVYKVNYYKQNLADDEYTLADSKDMTGTTDELTKAEAADIEGFTLRAFEQASIKPDGSTVIDIYYDRNSYNISWDVNGGNALTGTYTDGSVKFDSKFTKPADPARVGYTFGGWYVDKTYEKQLPAYDTVPAEDLMIYAKWIANTDTKYTVEYYTQNLENDEYTRYRTANMTGTSDEPANVELDDIEGFTAQDFEKANVAADGSTVIKIYYSRNSYSISWDMNGGDDLTVNDHTNGTVKYGSVFTLPSVEPTRAGYTFIGWYLDKDGNDPLPAYATVPAQDLTIYAKWQSEGTKYLVKYYTENLYDDDYTLEETITKYGKSGEMTEAEFPDKEGFTISGDSQVEIAGDGSTVVEVRYKRIRYNVKWDTAESGVTGYSPEGPDVKYGTPVIKPAETPKKDGYKFIKWIYNRDGMMGDLADDAVINDDLVNIPGGTQIYIDAYFMTKEYAKYTVKWETYGGSELTGDYTHGDDIDYNAIIHTPDMYPSKEGFIFDGWYTDKEFTKPLDKWAPRVTEDTTIYAKWVPDTSVEYTVEHMIQNADDDDYTTEITESRYGEAGSETSAVTYISYDDRGFEIPEVKQQTIAADGSTVVEIKYDRKKCTVYWVLKDGTSATTSVKYGAIAVAPYGSEQSYIVDGKRYIFKGWYTDEACTEPLGDSTRIYDTEKIYAGYDVDSTYSGYGITVAGVEVTNKNCSDILSTGDNKGKVSYDSSTNTLTLNNVNIKYDAEETYINNERSSSVIITDPNAGDANGDLKIKLIGSNTIRNTHAPFSSMPVTGILVNGSLTIEGDSSASLTVEVAENSVGINRAIYFDKKGKMYINGPEVIANAENGSKSYGIYAGSELEPADICIQSGSVEVNGYTAGMMANVKQVYSETDSGSDITVTSASTDYNGSFESGVSFTALSTNLLNYKHVRIAIEK